MEAIRHASDRSDFVALIAQVATSLKDCPCGSTAIEKLFRRPHYEHTEDCILCGRLIDSFLSQGLLFYHCEGQVLQTTFSQQLSSRCGHRTEVKKRL